MAAMAVAAGYCDRNYRVRAGKANRWGAVAARERAYSAGGVLPLGAGVSAVAGRLVGGVCERNCGVGAGKATRWGAVAARERVYSAGGFSLLGMEFSEVAGL